MARSDGAPARGVRVWSARTDRPAAQEEALLDLLTPAERERYAGMPREARSPYVTAHALLRLGVARVLEVAPRRLHVVRDAVGRPVVPAAPWLRLSLSHTRGAVLVGCSAGSPLGLDVERVRPVRGERELAARVLDPADLTRWSRLARPAARPALFARWTCKEAVLKGLGTGLAGGLRRVRAEPGDPHRWSVAGAPVPHWLTTPLAVGPHHVAALALPAAGSDQTLLEGERHGQRAVGGVQLGEQVGDVPLDAVLGDGEPSGDLLVAHALGEQREHLLLTGGEGDLA
ncbi:hypothetical protein DVZ84_34955 [Streptomyces parvulus]|uniref:4'-phosphopantetheinyl transferase domain-containing protein n=1 Tax=Streptomyces parvulus TaxID=146923 RepID=A0A369UWT0_9ACTN|nr:hypothetical protein DVZ84_34955 [Streptomyces parvulus]